MAPPPTASSNHRTAVVFAGIGTLLVTAYAGLAALQILVLNPLAAAPGKELDQIHADMAAAGESMSTPMALGVLSAGVGLGIVLFVLIALSRNSTPQAAVLGYLVLLIFGTPAYFIASFGAGMGLADTYGISGGDYSPWAQALYLISLLAFVSALTIGVIDLSRRHRKMTSLIAT